jgi:mitochondrial fission protein ELM1
MNILSICPEDYNYEQIKGIIYWINRDNVNKSCTLKLPKIPNLFITYGLLLLYFCFFSWFTFVTNDRKFKYVFVCGRSVVPQAIIIAHQLRIPLCAIQKPYGYPAWFFKYMFVPHHDLHKYPRSNQVSTIIAPNTYKYDLNLLNRNKNLISVLIGGSLHGKPYDITKIVNLFNDLNHLKKNDPEKIINVIVSRRTPIQLLEYLENNHIPINTKNHAIHDAYYTSSIVIITDDSYCMISEAIQSGVVPLIIKTANLNERMHSGIHYLFEEGYVDYFEETNIERLNMRFQERNILDKINIKDIL